MHTLYLRGTTVLVQVQDQRCTAKVPYDVGSTQYEEIKRKNQGRADEERVACDETKEERADGMDKITRSEARYNVTSSSPSNSLSLFPLSSISQKPSPGSPPTTSQRPKPRIRSQLGNSLPFAQTPPKYWLGKIHFGSEVRRSILLRFVSPRLPQICIRTINARSAAGLCVCVCPNQG